MGTVRAAGAQPVITVNYGSGTPDEAAAWVRYANITKGYGIKYWEVGNEVPGNREYSNGSGWELDKHSSHSATTYATNLLQFVSVVGVPSTTAMPRGVGGVEDRLQPLQVEAAARRLPGGPDRLADADHREAGLGHQVEVGFDAVHPVVLGVVGGPEQDAGRKRGHGGPPAGSVRPTEHRPVARGLTWVLRCGGPARRLRTGAVHGAGWSWLRRRCRSRSSRNG
ncbi:hypothetical protein PV333_41195 [Streptomyces sp. NY05-11A]|nr:hypothetical protein [Streptomyces sp. NY05-11A]MDX2682608.1 hypothetical protein [Streptomyces sp. NY05-11A]